MSNIQHYLMGEAKHTAIFMHCTHLFLANPWTFLFRSQRSGTLLILHLLLSGMSQSLSFSSASKPNYNKHFPCSFLLNYGRALENLPDDKVLARLKDWNCEWLSRPNIGMSEFCSTLKENLPLIQQYKGTVFTDTFVEDLEEVVAPLIPQMQRLDNKDRATNDPPTQKDVLDVLEAVNEKKDVEQLFVDAFNATGPLLMMDIHTMAINTLLHNPSEFANHTLRCPATESFKEDPSDNNMMRYLLDGILMRRRSVQRTCSLWDRSRYQEDQEEEQQERRSRPGQRLDGRDTQANTRRRAVTTTATPRSRLHISAMSTALSASPASTSARRASRCTGSGRSSPTPATSTPCGRQMSTPKHSKDLPDWGDSDDEHLQDQPSPSPSSTPTAPPATVR